LILEFNDTPEGLVVDIEVIAGIPHKGYDERAPQDGFLTAAGMNEMFTAPLLARQKGSVDWEESINAITRHTIEEFSNLQHFVPYLFYRHSLLGKAGLNWMPTLGTWLQAHKKSPSDGTSISFYKALAAAAEKQINLANTTHAALVDAGLGLTTHTFQAATDLLAASIGKLAVPYAHVSNSATKLSYELNAASNASMAPGSQLQRQAVAEERTRQALQYAANATARLSGLKPTFSKEVVFGNVSNGEAAKTLNIRFGFGKRQP
jgi:hypothetical protein